MQFGCVEVRDETEQEDYVGKRNVAEERTRNDINSSKEEVIVEDVDDDDDDSDGEVEEDDEEEEKVEDEDEERMETEHDAKDSQTNGSECFKEEEEDEDEEGTENELQKLSMMPRIHKAIVMHVLKYQDLKLHVMLIPVAANWQLINKKMRMKLQVLLFM